MTRINSPEWLSAPRAYYQFLKRAACPALLAGILTLAASPAQAVFLRGQPFTPTGADFSIFALQGIDSSSPQGKTGFSPQVNGDFEFPNSIGVAYDQGHGTLKNFGIGLYNNAQNQVQSTGLRIQYNQLVDAASVKITIEDFDISTKSTSFNLNKVEPSILLLGPGGSIYGSASPAAIFPNLTPNTTSGSKSTDVWDLNFAQLINTLHLPDASISGFILYADTLAGETPNSDPYLLVSAGSGIPMVPEPSNYLVGMVAIAIVGVSHFTFLRRKNVTVSKAILK